MFEDLTQYGGAPRGAGLDAPGNIAYLLRGFRIGFLVLGLCRFGTDLALLVGVAIVVSIPVSGVPISCAIISRVRIAA